VFGKRAGEFAAEFARTRGDVALDDAEIDAGVKYALAPFDRGADAEGAYQVQDALQSTMQDLVGIVRAQHEMEQALDELETLKQRAEKVGVPGNREYNPGWHTALDLRNLLIVSEAIARSALARKESRGGHFRDDYPEKDPAFSTFNHVVRRGANGEMELARETIPPLPAELAAIIEEMK
jgi:succinate dehydrogenase flavoprotein subunit